jgi:hypothetical protein
MDPSQNADLESRFQGLKQLFYYALFALIVTSVAVNIYLGKQMRLARAQLAEQRQSIGRLAEDFYNASEPLIRDFSVAMQSFAATNKDFAPIFDKYRPAFSKYLSGSPVAPAPATAPNPATSSPPR